MPEISDAEHRTFIRLTDLAEPHGGPDGLRKKVESLTADNHKYRQEEKPALERELAELRPLRADGAVVLTGEDAKRWDAVQKLGKTPAELAAGLVLVGDDRKRWEAWEALNLKPEDVATVLTERDELKTKDAARSRRDAIAAAVEAMGWPKETTATLEDLKSLDGATFEVKTEKGKNAKGEDADLPVAYVTVAGQQPVKLAEFATKTESLKGLRTSASEGTTEDRSYPDQRTGGNSNAGGYDPVAEGRRRGEAQGTDKARRDTALS